VGTDVYLTFDDGPIPEVTPQVLAILAQYKVKATFFMVGENIDKHPDIFRMVLDAGHAVGNHTYNHLKGIKYSCSEYLSNVRKWEEAFQRNYHITHPSSLFRPPYGKAWFWQRRAIARRGYELVYWDVLTRDYDRTQTPEAMLARIKRCTRPGSIINFHDSLKSNERMLAVLPLAIEWLRAQGYELKCIN
jgi:peptidoglycan/xylan/chitin deacetylase (PgdA/CDA1 family)